MATITISSKLTSGSAFSSAHGLIGQYNTSTYDHSWSGSYYISPNDYTTSMRLAIEVYNVSGYTIDHIEGAYNVTNLSGPYDLQGGRGKYWLFNITTSAQINVYYKVKPSYSVGLSKSPSEGGSVSGGGTYTEGTTVTCRATPNSEWEFTKWTEQGSTWESTSNPYIFDIYENRYLTAHFKHNNYYNVSITKEPSSGGTVTGNGRYKEGTKVTCKATPNQGFKFVGWIEQGATVSTNTTYEFYAYEDRYLTAKFRPIDPVELTMQVEPSEAIPYVTLSGSGVYDVGDTVTISATISGSIYTFVAFTYNDITLSTKPTYTFTITSDMNIKVLVKKEGYAYVEVLTSPSGSGDTVGSGIKQIGSVITIGAFTRTYSEYKFDKWDSGETTNTKNVEVTPFDRDNRHTAFFIPKKKYITTLAVVPNDADSQVDMFIEGPGVERQGKYAFNLLEQTTVHLKVTYGEFWVFQGWYYRGSLIGTDEDQVYQFPAITNNENITILAAFRPIKEINHKLTLLFNPYANPETYGIIKARVTFHFYNYITGEKQEVIYNLEQQEGVNKGKFEFSVPDGAAITIEAYTRGETSGDLRWIFKSFSPPTTTLTYKNIYKITHLSTDTSITINYTDQIMTYRLEVYPDDTYGYINNMTGDLIPGETNLYRQASGTDIYLTANAYEGRAFNHWTLDGKMGSYNFFLELTNVTVDTCPSVIHAWFKAQAGFVTIYTEVRPKEGGSILGGGIYRLGEVVTLTLTLEEGYTLDRWSNGDTTTTITFTADNDKRLIAYLNKPLPPTPPPPTPELKLDIISWLTTRRRRKRKIIIYR